MNLELKLEKGKFRAFDELLGMCNVHGKVFISISTIWANRKARKRLFLRLKNMPKVKGREPFKEMLNGILNGTFSHDVTAWYGIIYWNRLILYACRKPSKSECMKIPLGPWLDVREAFFIDLLMPRKLCQWHETIDDGTRCWHQWYTLLTP